MAGIGTPALGTTSGGGGGGSSTITSFLGVTTVGQKSMANSFSVTIASDQSAVPISGTVTANAGTGTFNIQSNASVNLNQIAGNAVQSAGQNGTLSVGGQTGRNNALTGANNPILIGGSDYGGTPKIQVPAVDASGNQQMNISQVGGNAVVTSGVNGLLAVGGNIASGSSDSGNPVKTGGIYNSTNITLTNGQRGDTQMTVNGFSRVDLGTNIAGEDFTVNVMKVEERFSYNYISTATTTVVKGSAGFLHLITVLGGTAGTITIYDNTAGSGTIIAAIDSTAYMQTYFFDVTFATGFTVVTSQATKLTVSYR